LWAEPHYSSAIGQSVRKLRGLVGPLLRRTAQSDVLGSEQQRSVCFGDNTIEWALRQRVISSFENLFREFFAVRCKPVLGHLSEEGSPLNMACYMCWEFDCWHSTPSPALLPVMRSTLAIDHVARQESALHGLGHWYHRGQAAAVQSIIGEFLGREPHLRAELREYARSARIGYVL
jgi:hypothetical protein